MCLADQFIQSIGLGFQIGAMLRVMQRPGNKSVCALAQQNGFVCRRSGS